VHYHRLPHLRWTCVVSRKASRRKIGANGKREARDREHKIDCVKRIPQKGESYRSVAKKCQEQKRAHKFAVPAHKTNCIVDGVGYE